MIYLVLSRDNYLEFHSKYELLECINNMIKKFNIFPEKARVIIKNKDGSRLVSTINNIDDVLRIVN